MPPQALRTGGNKKVKYSKNFSGVTALEKLGLEGLTGVLNGFDALYLPGGYEQRNRGSASQANM